MAFITFGQAQRKVARQLADKTAAVIYANEGAEAALKFQQAANTPEGKKVFKDLVKPKVDFIKQDNVDGTDLSTLLLYAAIAGVGFYFLTRR